MKSLSVWKRNKAGRKTRPASKPKIHWELLGLSDPESVESITSLESIRRELTLLASTGFGQGTRSRSSMQENTGRNSGRKRTGQTGGESIGRRGTTG